MCIAGEEEYGKNKGRSKYTAEEAHAELLVMTLPDTGLKKYNSTPKYGPLLKETQVKEVYQGLKKKLESVGLATLKIELTTLQDAIIEEDNEANKLELSDKQDANQNQGHACNLDI